LSRQGSLGWKALLIFKNKFTNIVEKRIVEMRKAFYSAEDAAEPDVKARSNFFTRR
jgi:hypothetical protein